MKPIRQLLRKCAEDFYPGTEWGCQISKPQGWGRIGLLFLIGMIVLVDWPFLIRHYIVGHDTKQILGIFDYFYCGWFYSGELPRWMAYGLQGLDATPFYLAFISASNFLAMFAGKLLRITDSLTLFVASVCVEQLLLLLGMYLLSVRLYRERITVFCICLTAALMIEWQFQLFFNLRLFCLLPLEFFLILRLAESRAGWLGWLAGVVAIIGPTGSTYAYMFWGFILTIFGLSVFWGRFGALKSMLKFSIPNILMAAVFVLVAAFFCGSLYHAMDNFAYTSPGRGTDGNVSLLTFLTYGGDNFSKLIASLLLPATFMANIGGNAGMSNYIGLVGIICLPWALWNLHRYRVAWPFAIAGASIMMLSLGGIFASLVYWFPGMHLFRHIGFLTGAIKVIILILAGFGMDQLVQQIRDGKLFSRPNTTTLVLAAAALMVYLDSNIGGPVWAGVIKAAEKGPAILFSQLEDGAIYPIARVILLFICLLSAWQSCRSFIGPNPKSKNNFALSMLVVCVLADGVLFQSELYTTQNKATDRVVFPVERLNWPYGNKAPEKVDDAQHVHSIDYLSTVLPFEQMSGNIIKKYNAWTNSLGVEYQVAVSSVLQWDPATPSFRTDWLPKNIAAMRAAVGQTNRQSFLSLPGLDGTRFRLMPDESIKYVKTDAAAIDLLKKHSDWSKQVIITGEAGSSSDGPKNSSTSIANCRLEKLDFSANAYSLSVSNGMPKPVWLIDAAAYSPAWKVVVNHQAVTLYKAYGACRAVRLAPGFNLVQFEYRHSFRSICLAGFAVTAGILVASGLLLLVWLVKRELFN